MSSGIDDITCIKSPLCRIPPSAAGLRLLSHSSPQYQIEPMAMEIGSWILLAELQIIPLVLKVTIKEDYLLSAASAGDARLLHQQDNPDCHANHYNRPPEQNRIDAPGKLSTGCTPGKCSHRHHERN